MPGWYPDPYSPTSPQLRWWDGTQWTGYVSGPPRPDPQVAYANEAKSVRYARWGLIVWVVLLLPSFILGLTTQQRASSDIVNIFDIRNPQPIRFTTLDMFSLATLPFTLLAVLAVFWWLWRAMETTKAIGLPQKFSPVWAFFCLWVPVINFWFPYQCFRDNFPANAPGRILAKRWQVCWIAQLTLAICASIFNIFNLTPVGRGFSVASLIVGLVAVYLLWKLVTTTKEAHAELIASGA